MAEVLGRPAQPLLAQPPHAVVIARERQSVGSDDSRCDFDIVLTAPALRLSEDELLQVSHLHTRQTISYNHLQAALLGRHVAWCTLAARVPGCRQGASPALLKG